MVELRPATPADAPAVARIWYPGWCDAHLGNLIRAALIRPAASAVVAADLVAEHAAVGVVGRAGLGQRGSAKRQQERNGEHRHESRSHITAFLHVATSVCREQDGSQVAPAVHPSIFLRQTLCREPPG